MPKRIGLGLLSVVVLLLHVGLLPILIMAQEQQAVDLQANEVQYEFPEELSFHLEITALSPVETVELEYGVDKVSCEEPSVRIVPDLSEDDELPGRIHADWTWDFHRSGSLPPGTRIWWRWHATLESDESWVAPLAWVTFEDDRHDWQTVEQGQITVHWYEGDQDFGLEMLQAAVEAQARLTADPGANLEKALNLYFYATPEELRDALVFSQRWAGGIAFPDYYTILIGAGPNDQVWGRKTVAHELMHLVVHQLAFNCWGDLPTWLDEGLATWAEGGLDPGQQEALDKAITEDKLISLRSLGSGFSAHSSRASLSYAQSYSVVVFLIDKYGREKMLDLLAVFREGASYDGALEQIYGFDTDDLEDLWRTSVGAGPRPTGVAPAGTSTPVPTLSLWGAEPTSQSSASRSPTPSPSPEPAVPRATTLSPSPLPSLSPEPAVTDAPEPTAVATPSAPAQVATAERSAVPTPIGGTTEERDTDHGIWYVIGGSAALGVLLLIVVGVYIRRR